MLDPYEKYLNYSLKFLSYRQRSEKEIKDALIKKQANPQTIEKVINRLNELNFIDDLQFSISWIKNRKSIKPKSERLIRYELKQKGVKDQTINEAFEKSNSEVKSEKQTAVELINKRKDRYKDLSKLEKYQKIGQFLSRKGFSWETIRSAVDEAFTKRV